MSKEVFKRYENDASPETIGYKKEIAKGNKIEILN